MYLIWDFYVSFLYIFCGRDESRPYNSMFAFVRQTSVTKH